MDRRRLSWALAGVLAVLAAVLGYTLAKPSGMESGSDKVETAKAKEDDRFERACASIATNDRLKELVFEEAARIRNADPANLQLLATNSVVRMENPVVVSRDSQLNATVCRGRFVLEVPPGAERGLGGDKRLTADIEYTAQEAADGSGLVYRLSGADAIVSRLASFDLNGQRLNVPDEVEVARAEETEEPAEQPEPDREPESRREAAPAPRPVPPVQQQPRPQPAPVAASPSFNCRYASTRSERMVCASSRLAALDRQMASRYNSAMAEANRRARTALLRTRNRFLAYRERCPTEACIADAYEGRMREIRDIMADLN